MCVCVYVCARARSVHAIACVWRSEDSFVESVTSHSLCGFWRWDSEYQVRAEKSFTDRAISLPSSMFLLVFMWVFVFIASDVLNLFFFATLFFQD